jgi:Ca-activated chloride channel homolog
VSFIAAPYLLGLLVLPGLLAGYVYRARGRGQAALAFAAPSMAPSVSPQRPGWRRHAPMAAFLLASGLLIVASARPRVTISVPVEHLESLLALDMSGSMQATDVAPNRATAAQRAADAFTTAVPAKVNIGVMQFNQSPTLLQPLTGNRAAVLSALGSLRIGGGTSIGAAIQTAMSVLSPTGTQIAKGTTAVVILLSDGGSTSGPNPVASARQAARLHIPIFTVSLGTAGGTIMTHGRASATPVLRRVPPDPQALAEIAQVSGGRAYTATDADRLADIYRQLSVQLAHRKQSEELTAYLVGAGLALLLLGSALSLLWFGRLI